MLLGTAAPANACSVPVFRYALEQWPPTPFELVAFHRGGLSAFEQAALARLSASTTNATGATANLLVRTVDLSTNPSPAWPQLANFISPTSPPALALFSFKDRAQLVWTGPLNDATVRLISDSPVRRQIVKGLLSGQSAVWLLLESGHPSQDNAAAELLRRRLAHLEKVLDLPRPDPGDATVQPSAADSELKIAFSLLRLSRADPLEAVLIQSLLAAEDDLTSLRQPMAFAVFGRGRALPPLVGKGINEETIEEACTFLVGPCSCLVKEQNPGTDLLLTADWDRLPGGHLTTEAANPDLPSVAAVDPGPPLPSRGSSVPSLADPLTPPSAPPPAPASAISAPRPARGGFRFAVAILAGFAAAALVAGGVLLFRARQR